jgi:mycothiol synthase
MMMASRPYRDWNDFEKMQRFVAELRQDVAQTHCLHRGDLAWQLFHMLNNYAPSDLVQLWEDDDGTLLGFALAYIPFGFFDVQIHPNHRHALEEDTLSWAEGQLKNSNNLFALVNEHDISRIRLLEQHGFKRGDVWHYLERALDTPVPEPRLPEGFVTRAIRDISEAEAHANLLAAAFEGVPDGAKYRLFMQSPAYHEVLDLVVAAPDSTLAAFALVWLDPISKCGQFEPVGTAPAYRRLGLSQALLLDGLRQMREHAMEKAFVIVEGADNPAVELYQSVGLVPRWNLYLYSK